LPDAAITEFRSNPAQLLSAFPDGGSRMILQVRRLAGSDSGVVDLIIEQAKMANPSQVSAIGAGLAQVVRACVPTRPDIAELIQQKITLAGLQSLTTAFQAGLGDVETAGIGGGGGGGAAGGGVAGSGGVFGTSGPAAGIGGGGVLTGQFSFGSLGVSSSGGGGSTVIFNTFINNGSVSPVQ
jgi:hypothetical protein